MTSLLNEWASQWQDASVVLPLQLQLQWKWQWIANEKLKNGPAENFLRNKLTQHGIERDLQGHQWKRIPSVQVDWTQFSCSSIATPIRKKPTLKDLSMQCNGIPRTYGIHTNTMYSCFSLYMTLRQQRIQTQDKNYSFDEMKLTFFRVEKIKMKNWKTVL